jgi:hypothetical protein
MRYLLETGSFTKCIIAEFCKRVDVYSVLYTTGNLLTSLETVSSSYQCFPMYPYA